MSSAWTQAGFWKLTPWGKPFLHWCKGRQRAGRAASSVPWVSRTLGSRVSRFVGCFSGLSPPFLQAGSYTDNIQGHTSLCSLQEARM